MYRKLLIPIDQEVTGFTINILPVFRLRDHIIFFRNNRNMEIRSLMNLYYRIHQSIIHLILIHLLKLNFQNRNSRWIIMSP
jgi:hypothetical protein